MKCPKCEKETDDRSKFCSHCGEKVEEIPMHVQVESLIKDAAKTWFILGVVRSSSKNEKNKGLEKFEKILQKDHWEMWGLYQEVIGYWKEWAKQKDEKNKKETRSKRTSISKTEGNQKD